MFPVTRTTIPSILSNHLIFCIAFRLLNLHIDFKLIHMSYYISDFMRSIIISCNYLPRQNALSFRFFLKLIFLNYTTAITWPVFLVSVLQKPKDQLALFFHHNMKSGDSFNMCPNPKKNATSFSGKVCALIPSSGMIKWLPIWFSFSL